MKKVEQNPSVPPPSGAAGAGSLEELFEHARSDGFTHAQTEALWGRIGAAMAAPRPPSPASASGLTTGMKAVAAALVGGGLVAAGVMAHGWRTTSPVERTAPVTIVAPAKVGAVAAPAPVPPADPGTPQVAIDDLPRAVDPSQAGSQNRPAGSDRREVTRGLQAPHTVDPSTPALTPAPGLAAVPARTPDSTVAAQDVASPAANEGALLLHARQELATDPAVTLALAQEHARRFPAGTLIQEREVLAIEALARLGRTSEARSRLDAFRARFPQSPHLVRLGALLERTP